MTPQPPTTCSKSRKKSLCIGRAQTGGIEILKASYAPVDVMVEIFHLALFGRLGSTRDRQRDQSTAW